MLRKGNLIFRNKEILNFINLTTSYHDWCINFKAPFQADDGIEQEGSQQFCLLRAYITISWYEYSPIPAHIL